MIKKLFFWCGLLSAVLTPSFAAEKPVNTTLFGVALHGYDPVAYFTDGKAVEGTKDYSADWKGAQFRFASAEHRERFKAAPEKYAPQFGGYCAYAVSKGYTADVDPNAWKIVNGKLYLNYDKKVQGLWEQEQDARIRAAEENWPKLTGHK